MEGNRSSIRAAVEPAGPSGTACVPRTLPSALYSATCDFASKLVVLDQRSSVVVRASNSTSVIANARPGSAEGDTLSSEPASIQAAPRIVEEVEAARTHSEPSDFITPAVLSEAEGGTRMTPPCEATCRAASRFPVCTNAYPEFAAERYSEVLENGPTTARL